MKNYSFGGVFMKMTRYLTKDEIDDILSFISPQMNIPKETLKSIKKIHKIDLETQLKTQKIYPQIIPQLKKKLKEQYFSTLIQPGECIGITTAQSIGERQTQTTLDVFHKAGSSEKTATTGVPRFSELLNATKSPKLTNCIVFFKKGTDSIQNLSATISHSLVGFTLKRLSDRIDININKTSEKWYGAYQEIYGFDFDVFKDCLTIHLKPDLIYEYKIPLKIIAEKIENEYSDVRCIYSPISMCQLDIFVESSEITLPSDRLLFIDHENKIQIYLEEVVKPTLENMCVCGIEGIENIFYTQKNGEWFVETNGSNYIELLSHPNVDMTRTMSNNIWDIYKVLGIEAVRQFLIEDFSSIMEGISLCNPKMLVDRMTYNGTISSVSRYTMRDEEGGPLGKASFEETMDNFLKAAFYGQVESTKGVSASIICGKRANMGTGLCDLQIDFDRLPCVEEKDDENDDEKNEEKNGKPKYIQKFPLKKSIKMAYE